MAPFCSMILWSILVLIISFSCVPFVCSFSNFRLDSSSGKGKYDSISFLALGDWGRNGTFNQSMVATQMGKIGEKLGIDFVVSTGDNFYDSGLKSVYDPYFKTSFTNIYTAKSLHKPWYVVLGNHDYNGDTWAQLNPYLNKRDKRWFCQRNFILNTGVADLVFIDTTPFVDDYFINLKKKKFDWRGVLPRDKYMYRVKKFLDLSLKKSKSQWKIVVGHHTIRSIGHHGDTKAMVDHILPILEANKVDMYINGHDHCLQHLSNGNGTMQFLTSGGGSKAWKNDIHYEVHKDILKFFHDGQGFLYVKVTKYHATIAFYDVFGKVLHGGDIKA